MSAVLGRRRSEAPSGVLLLTTVALVVAATLSLRTVFLDAGWVRPVLTAALLSLGVSWGARRYDVGPLSTLLLSALAWLAFTSVAFARDTLGYGVVPTGATLDALRALWLRGLELMQLRPAPTFAEAGLVLITLTGVWAVAHAVDGLVFRTRTPLRAIAMAFVLFTVPLAMAPAGTRPWGLAAPLLSAAAVLLLVSGVGDLARWGQWVGAPTPAASRPGSRPASRPASQLIRPSGAAMAVLAIAAGSVFASALPGFGEPPWYQVRGMGGTTLTTNPIVNIRARLVATDQGPVLRVRTDRPVYLRTTALDVYSADEEWTSRGIRGRPVERSLPPEVRIGQGEPVYAEVVVEGLDRDTVLLPVPYQPLRLTGSLEEHVQYDARNATVTLDRDAEVTRDDEYHVESLLPSPDAHVLDAIENRGAHPAYTELPDNVPASVAELAHEIVTQAGATTPFRQALAIQDTLRRWEYSLDPPEGHSGQAMAAFIANRVGYCEQYAGTMAVMLRTLGIPARVAVGYTPGERVPGDAEEYVITNANAHAWVEVLFPGAGWIAFEPTPRDDGNVVVPNAANVAPPFTLAEASPGQISQPAMTDEQEQREIRENANAPSPEPEAAPDASEASAPAASEPRERSLAPLLAILAVAALAGAALRAARRAAAPGGPHLRVLRAHARVERLGAASGAPRRPWETDGEYLRRVATLDEAGAPERLEHAAVLAAAVAQTRWRDMSDDSSAAAAESAAHHLHDDLLSRMTPLRRALVRARMPVAAAIASAGAQVRAVQRLRVVR